MKQDRKDATSVHKDVSSIWFLNMFVRWVSFNLGDSLSRRTYAEFLFAQSHHG